MHHQAKKLKLKSCFGKQRNVAADIRFSLRSGDSYVGLGEKDKALEQLTKAYEDRAGWIIYLKVESIFDPIRSDPRLNDLIVRMKL